MQCSESLSKLAPALVAFHGEVQDVVKNRQGQFDYADLEAVLNTIRPLALKHGLCFPQLGGDLEKTEDGLYVVIETVILHVSGERMSGEIKIPVDTARKAQSMPQAFGSAWTYGRRYALQGATGLVARADDDDGASGGNGSGGGGTFQMVKETPAPASAPASAPVRAPEAGGSKKEASEKTMNFISKLLDEKAWKISTVEGECQAMLETINKGDLPSQMDASRLIDALMTIPTTKEVEEKKDGLPF